MCLRIARTGILAENAQCSPLPRKRRSASQGDSAGPQETIRPRQPLTCNNTGRHFPSMLQHDDATEFVTMDGSALLTHELQRIFRR